MDIPRELTATQITEIAAKIIKLLGPLAPGDRQKIIQASLTLLGEPADMARGADSGPSPGHGSSMVAAKVGHNDHGIPARPAAWLKQNGITPAQLENVYDFADGAVSVIAELEDKSDKENTLNAFILYGLGKFLVSGNPSFDDKGARDLCVTSGCYNSANHAVYMGAKGNLFTGSKVKGWRLTAPGLKRGADLVKTLAKGT